MTLNTSHSVVGADDVHVLKLAPILDPSKKRMLT